MKMFIASALILLAGGATYNSLHNHNDCAGFLPKNDLKIPVMSNFTNSGGLTEKQFNDVIDRVESVYAEIIEETGNTLVVNRLWNVDEVNASARQIKKDQVWEVNMYGGLARHSAIGVEAFTTVLCHELGHHLGGAPRKAFLGWASNEGQSDYYAATKCIRKLYSAEENAEYVQNIELDEYARSACDYVFEDDVDRLANCYRSAKAGQDIALMFRDLNNLNETPEFDTPDTKVVSSTFDSHPEPQCRLDTYFNGALCSTSHDIDFGESDATTGACNRVANAANDNADIPKDVGTRPLCWFKPDVEIKFAAIHN